MNNVTSIWDYYLTLENDLLKTYQYVEPKSQENVYSFEYGKLIMLSCAELETVFKMFCKCFKNKECGNIGEYKEIILKHYPKIVDAEVNVARYKSRIIPFENWSNEGGKLFWWDEYVDIKHNMHEYMSKANIKNTIYALSGLYIAIQYYAYQTRQDINDYKSECISSEYSKQILVCTAPRKLPGT